MTEELIAELRATFLFEPFSEEQLYWLLGHSEVVELAAGEYALRENERPDALWVLLSGAWRLSRTLGGRKVVFSEASTPGVWAGWLAVLDNRLFLDLQATAPSRVLRIPSTAVQHMMVSGYPIASHMINGIYQGIQTMVAQTREQEKMIALGKLSAGLAHELNNPASAAHSAALELRRVLREGQTAALDLTGAERTPDGAASLAGTFQGLVSEMAERAAAAPRLDPLARSDREDIVAAWLDDHGVPDSYETAGTLVDAGLDAAWLEDVARRVPAEAQQPVLRSITAAAAAATLLDQIENSTVRISELVAAIKSYSYMDQAPLQEIDIHQGIESTLTMLGHKLRAGIKVVRDYDGSLPRIHAVGSDLNQVWTNLIDNAIDAMEGKGELRISTRRDDSEVVVEIADSGHGIPEEIQSRIFDPFFTTKDVGQGTGLGLDIAYRIIVKQHHGDIALQSRAGETAFTVRLPIAGPDAETAAAAR